MTVRERSEQIEAQVLGPHAARAAGSRGRQRPEEPCPYRTAFQRDRDRILHCKAFRRLKHKTQVFLAPEGDHYRTRLTHTLEVSQIARTIARALRLNEDLTEAIALGHDLGHTPFGHAGERALSAVMEGGFRHYEQSVRVCERLEREGAGLNLTWEVLDGILCHTKGQQAATWEGRVVRLADRIAYITHDIDDAARAGVLREEDVPAEVQAAIGRSRSVRIHTLVCAVVEHSRNDVVMDPAIAGYFQQLHDFMFDAVYLNPIAKGEESKAMDMLRQLYTYFVAHPDQLPAEFARICDEEGAPRAAGDYLAGMTDNYALDTFADRFIPRGWQERGRRL